MALRPLHRNPSLDAPPPDNAALPEAIATLDHVESPEKDVTPGYAALPDSSDHPLEYPSRHEASPQVPTNPASGLNSLDIFDDLAWYESTTVGVSTGDVIFR